MQTEAQKRAKKKYDDANAVQMRLRLNNKSDAAVLERLEYVSTMEGGKQGYIKRLIREDMK